MIMFTCSVLSVHIVCVCVIVTIIGTAQTSRTTEGKE